MLSLSLFAFICEFTDSEAESGIIKMARTRATTLSYFSGNLWVTLQRACLSLCKVKGSNPINIDFTMLCH